MLEPLTEIRAAPVRRSASARSSAVTGSSLRLRRMPPSFYDGGGPSGRGSGTPGRLSHEDRLPGAVLAGDLPLVAVRRRRRLPDGVARLDRLAAHAGLVVVDPGAVLLGAVGDRRHRP